ncbi:MAG: hypothetical protein DHS80DRAFT_24318 [Piptocephalis tieghemiana]|nr:MAG: hypothetical protein DHS80DRAFT_24318 [Piptocephalis tieghemiana]
MYPFQIAQLLGLVLCLLVGGARPSPVVRQRGYVLASNATGEYITTFTHESEKDLTLFRLITTEMDASPIFLNYSAISTKGEQPFLLDPSTKQSGSLICATTNSTWFMAVPEATSATCVPWTIEQSNENLIFHIPRSDQCLIIRRPNGSGPSGFAFGSCTAPEAIWSYKMAPRRTLTQGAYVDPSSQDVETNPLSPPSASAMQNPDGATEQAPNSNPTGLFPSEQEGNGLSVSDQVSSSSSSPLPSSSSGDRRGTISIETGSVADANDTSNESNDASSALNLGI